MQPQSSRELYIAYELLAPPPLFFTNENGASESPSGKRHVHTNVRPGNIVLFASGGEIRRAGRALAAPSRENGVMAAEFRPEEMFDITPALPLDALRTAPDVGEWMKNIHDDVAPLDGPARDVVVARLAATCPAFGEWLEPEPRLWLSTEQRDWNRITTAYPHEDGLWLAVPEGCAHGDYLLPWATGAGFPNLFRAIGQPRPATIKAGPPVFEGLHELVARFAHPITLEDLADDDVLREWRGTGREIAPPRHLLQSDFLEDSRFWPALRRLIIRKNPEVRSVIESLERSAGGHRLMSHISGYARDTAAGNADADLLSLKADFRMLASLLAAKAVEPPLAVGLFGEWGSGKSFFVQQVKREVALIAGRAAATRRDHQDASVFFHGDVVQIEFNAWHYADGNLWASLVDHLFTSLRDELRRSRGEGERDKADAEMAALLGELDTSERVQQAAAARSEQLQQKIDQTTAEVTSAKDGLAAQQAELAKLQRMDAWHDVSMACVSEQLRRDLEAGAQKHGFAPVAADARKLVQLGHRISATGSRAEVLWQSLRRAGVKPWQVGFLLGVLGAGLAVGPILAAAAEAGYIAKTFGAFFATVSQVLVLVAGLVKWAASRADWLSGRIAAVDSFVDVVQNAAAEVDKKVAMNAQKQNEDIAKAEGEIARLRVELEAAQRTRAEAERQQIQLLAQIEERLPEKRLADFIEERANSKDYREKLGIMAVVRRDFERLSDLLSMRHRTGPAFEEARRRLRRKTQAALPAIDRIVLYIDDLDRCTERKVVEVLRAVHLLLAYELFIVVVAVDAKWVSHSLEAVHRDLLRKDGSHGLKTSQNNRTPRATAADYLEKIFQVPFWLPAFSEQAARRLVLGLLRGQLERQADAQADDRELENIVASEPHDPAPDHPAWRPASLRREPPAKIELAPDNLRLTKGELTVLIQAAPLAGDTPRQAKRFTNLYRLLKVGLTRWELHRFLGRSSGAPTFSSAAVLLALVTGTPRATAEIFELIEHMPDDATLRDLANVILGLPLTPAVAPGDPLPPHLRALVAHDRELRSAGRRLALVAAALDPITCADLMQWFPVVGRFSFSRESLERR